jgi:transcriptional regulator with XRE-family HTH domain
LRLVDYLAGHGRALSVPLASVLVRTVAPVGELLRGWRERRRLSQLELANRAEVSTRHLSFVETGRSQPSRQLVLHLSEQLGVPLRERNVLLTAAGYARVYGETDLSAPEMRATRAAIDTLLRGHEPYPAVVVDRVWNLVAANAGVAALLAGVDPVLLTPPVNVFRVSLHPRGLAARVVNLPEVRAHLLARLARQVEATADPQLARLYEEVRGYPPGEPADPGPGPDVVIPVRLRAGPGGGELSFFTTVATFGAPADVTLEELAIELFFPADEQTRRAFTGVGAEAGGRGRGAAR